MEEVKIIQLATITDPRGDLSFFENNSPIPFTIQRTYWIYHECQRYSYAYKKTEVFITALSGRCDIVIDDGKIKKKYILTSPSYGLYIPKLHWCEINNFSKNCFLLIVTSCNFDESDYISNYNEFYRVVT